LVSLFGFGRSRTSVPDGVELPCLGERGSEQMRRMKIVGLCLVAVFAFAAVAGASSASAAEYGSCVSAKKGKYENADCTKLAAKKGSFEWAPAGSCYAMKKGKYAESGCATRDEKKGKPKGKWELAAGPAVHATSGLATLETPGVGNIECSASTTTGQITGAKTNLEQIVFTGCEAFGAPCENTPLSPSGEIATYELETTLEEPSAGVAETWFENSALTGHPYSSVFFCNAPDTFIRTKGSTGGVTTPTNVMGTSSTTVFSYASHQALLTEFYCSPGTSESWSGEAGATECPANGEPLYGPGIAPAGGEFFSEELVTGSTTTTPAMETRVMCSADGGDADAITSSQWAPVAHPDKGGGCAAKITITGSKEAKNAAGTTVACKFPGPGSVKAPPAEECTLTVTYTGPAGSEYEMKSQTATSPTYLRFFELTELRKAGECYEREAGGLFALGTSLKGPTESCTIKIKLYRAGEAPPQPPIVGSYTAVFSPGLTEPNISGTAVLETP
jgi:hypothetical protein